MKEPVLQWIYAGPFTLDVSNRYRDNYIVPASDYTDFWDEARRLLSGLEEVREGQPLSLYGQESGWKYYRVTEADRKLTFAGFGTYARLLASFFHTRLIAQRDGDMEFSFWFTGSAAVRINGQIVFSHAEVGRCDRSVTFTAPLHQGENTCEILL